MAGLTRWLRTLSWLPLVGLTARFNLSSSYDVTPTKEGWVDVANYRQEILRTVEDSLSPRDRLLLGGLGIAGEAGEVSDHIKKVIYLGHPGDEDHLLEELGDVLWYLGLICDTMGFSFEQVIVHNIQKQRCRYPNGFSSERSINRARFE